MLNKSLKYYENLSLTNVSFNNNFLKNIKKILKTGTYINGPFGKKLEKEFSKFIGVGYSINVSNGINTADIPSILFSEEEYCL